MSHAFRDRDVISITDFSRAEILDLCAAGRRMEILEKTGRRNSLRDALKHRSGPPQLKSLEGANEGPRSGGVRGPSRGPRS